MSERDKKTAKNKVLEQCNGVKAVAGGKGEMGWRRRIHDTKDQILSRSSKEDN